MRLPKPEKYAFVGSHGVGKTGFGHRLTAELITEGYGVEFVKEIARETHKRGVPINEGTTFSAQEAIFLEQKLTEISAEFVRPDFVVCDRSVIDNFMYLLYGYSTKGQEFSPGRSMAQTRSDVDTIRAQIIEYCQRKPYDLLIYVPIIETDVPNDETGVRSLNKEFQLAIDKMLKDYLSTNYKGSIYELRTDDLSENRKEWIDDIKKALRRVRSIQFKF